MYLIKFGNFYLAADGTLSTRQADALRLDPVTVDGLVPRKVRLRPYGSLSGRSVSAADEYDDPRR